MIFPIIFFCLLSCFCYCSTFRVSAASSVVGCPPADCLTEEALGQGATPMRSLTTHTHALLKSKAVPKSIRHESTPNCHIHPSTSCHLYHREAGILSSSAPSTPRIDTARPSVTGLPYQHWGALHAMREEDNYSSSSRPICSSSGAKRKPKPEVERPASSPAPNLSR